MATIDDVRRIVALDHGLAGVSTVRRDGSVHSVVVNAGIVSHPVTGEDVAGFVAAQGTVKLRHLHATPIATLLWRAGWAWAAVEGPVELAGPDDQVDGLAPDGVPPLLRAIYEAAGGDPHPDWAEYDRVMATERRVAVLVRPTRIYVNP